MVDLNKEMNNPYMTSGTEQRLKVKYWFIPGMKTQKEGCLPAPPLPRQEQFTSPSGPKSPCLCS